MLRIQLSNLILLDTSQVDVHNNLGDLWRAQNQLGQTGRQNAQHCYQEALRIDSMYAPAWRGLGDLYREMGNHSQAVLSYEQAIRAKPNYADAYTGMGVSLKELRRKDEAAVCFETVVKLRPGCALSLGNLAGKNADFWQLYGECFPPVFDLYMFYCTSCLNLASTCLSLCLVSLGGATS